MTDDTFTTDSTPGEQAFENTVDDAVGFFEAAFDAAGPRISGTLRSCIRAALRADGSAAPEQVADAARTLSEHDGLASDARVEPVLRRLEAMIDDTPGDQTGGIHG